MSVKDALRLCCSSLFGLLLKKVLDLEVNLIFAL